jgi:hypothetical protein
MKHGLASLTLVSLLLVMGCTPANVQYCRSFGVEATAEYDKCLAYYADQQAAFGASRSACELEADTVYPPTLYDYGGYAHTTFGTGFGGRYYGGQTIRVEPDFRKNAEVDRLRMRIIEPCMQAKGWNSGSSWQAGRHAVTPAKRVQKTSAKLPWLP